MQSGQRRRHVHSPDRVPARRLSRSTLSCDGEPQKKELINLSPPSLRPTPVLENNVIFRLPPPELYPASPEVPSSACTCACVCLCVCMSACTRQVWVTTLQSCVCVEVPSTKVSTVSRTGAPVSGDFSLPFEETTSVTTVRALTIRPKAHFFTNSRAGLVCYRLTSCFRRWVLKLKARTISRTCWKFSYWLEKAASAKAASIDA